MARITIVAHAPTELLAGMVSAVAAGAERVEGADVRTVPALDASAADLGDNDLTILLAPANLGSLAGALKHAFDHTFRELDGSTDGHPYLAIVRGASDVTGAVRLLESILTGLRWRAVRPTWTREGEVTTTDLQELEELGEALATAATMGAL